MTATFTTYRDGRDLVWGFAGDLPAGFEAFGWVAHTGRVVVTGTAGDRLPLLVACDWLRDHGVEVRAA